MRDLRSKRESPHTRLEPSAAGIWGVSEDYLHVSEIIRKYVFVSNMLIGVACNWDEEPRGRRS